MVAVYILELEIAWGACWYLLVWTERFYHHASGFLVVRGDDSKKSKTQHDDVLQIKLDSPL
jgi:hypothetical protein